MQQKSYVGTAIQYVHIQIALVVIAVGVTNNVRAFNEVWDLK